MGKLEVFQFLYLVVPVPAPDAAGYLSTISGAPLCSRAFRGASEGVFFLKKRKQIKMNKMCQFVVGKLFIRTSP